MPCQSCAHPTPGPLAEGSLPLLPQAHHPVECPECRQPCEEDCNNPCDSVDTYGKTLPDYLIGGYPAKSQEGVSLVARIGRKLAKLVGDGFIQIKDGKAYVVQTIAMNVRSLWHEFGISGGNTVPTIGEPKSFPFGIVADKAGNLYGIMGRTNRRSVQVWNLTTRQWDVLPVDQFPLEVSRKLSQANAVEITGFSPVPVNGDFKNVRELKTLFGNGIVYLERTVTPGDDAPPGCPSCPSDGLTAVAKVLEFPTIAPGDTDTQYQLVFSSTGVSWVLIEPDTP